MWWTTLYSGNADSGSDILEMLSLNVTVEEIIADFPDLEPEDIQASLLFAAKRTEFPRLSA